MQRDSLHRINSIAILAAAQIPVQMEFLVGTGVIAPTDRDAFKNFPEELSPGYQPFNAFVYSLDTFLPIINLGLKDKWTPDPKLAPRPKALAGTWLGDSVGNRFPRLAGCAFFNSGRALRVYLCCHVLLGWVLSTLFVAGFTGIIRR